MVYRKGERTDKHREAAYPHAVDIPIVGNGLGQNLNRILTETLSCAGGAEQWSHRTRKPNGDPLYWCRVGTKLPEDADRFAEMFGRLGAVRVR
jgi:hypothetical protein